MIPSNSKAGHVPAPRSAGPARTVPQTSLWRATLRQAMGDPKSPSPPAALADALLDRLVAHLGSATSEPRLDFSGLAPEAAMLFTEGVAGAFQRLVGTSACGRVLMVDLPERLTDLPGGVGALPDLHGVVIPRFAGTRLDLRSQEEALVAGRRVLQVVAHDARQLREILVQSPTAATECFSFRLSTLQKRKVELVGTDDGKASRRPVPGYVYVREALGRDRKQAERDKAFREASAVRLNVVVPFEGSDAMIVCRHIGVANAQRLAAYRRGKSAAVAGGTAAPPRLGYADFATPEGLRASVPWTTEALWDALLSGARENHLVALSSWDAFLRSQFATLKEGASRVLLVSSGNHLMDVELQVKPRPGGKADWIVVFHDPNPTAIHRRTAVDRSGRIPAAIEDQLPAAALASYFGADPALRMAHVIVPDPAELDGKAFAPGRAASGAAKRRLHTDHAGKTLTAVELHLRLRAGLVDGLAPRLKQALTLCAGKPDQALELLLACDPDGVSGLCLAMQNGEKEALGIVLAVAQDAAAAGLLPQDGLFKVMQALRGDVPVPGLVVAMQLGHAGPIQAWMDAARAAAKARLLTPQQLETLFEGRSAAGQPALWAALAGAREEAVSAWIDGVIGAARDGLIGRQSLSRLLKAAGGEGTPALFMALQEGHAVMARVLAAGALRAESLGLLARGDLQGLLLARRQDGTAALQMAMQLGHADAVKAYLDAALRATAQGLLDRDSLHAVLGSSPSSGIPALAKGLRGGQRAAVRAYVAAVLQAAAPRDDGPAWLSQERLCHLLLAPSPDRSAGLCVAAQRGHVSMVLEVLSMLEPAQSRALMDRLSPVERAVLLRETRAAAVAANGPGGLGLARGWARALLLSPLPDAEKLALLQAPVGEAGMLDRLVVDPELLAQVMPEFEACFSRLAGGMSRAEGQAGSRDLQGAVLAGWMDTLMQANAHTLVAALARSLGSGSGLPARERARLLLGWDPRAKASSLSRAMARGNVLAVQAWVEAALALPLEAADKRALLQGLPPDAGWRARSALRSAIEAQQSVAVLAWAQAIARAEAEQLSRADQAALLKRADKSHLMPPPRADRARDSQAVPAAGGTTRSRRRQAWEHPAPSVTTNRSG